MWFAAVTSAAGTVEGIGATALGSQFELGVRERRPRRCEQDCALLSTLGPSCVLLTMTVGGGALHPPQRCRPLLPRARMNLPSAVV